MSRRVVVTGMGLLCALGVGKDAVFKKLLEGHVGITHVKGKGFEKIPCKVAAYVPGDSETGQIDLKKYFSNSELKTMTTAMMYSILAAEEALTDAKWKPETIEQQERTGVAIGVGMIELPEVVNTGMLFWDKGYNKVNPHFIPKILPNMAAGHVSIKFGLMGPNHAVSTACATSLHSVGDASRMIIHGDADVMVCGGTEACVGPLEIAAFCRMRALSTNFNDDPSKSSRPFDKLRDGFVMGEGAAVLILEELEHAKKRGAKIYSEILGYGLSGDAHHITAPRADGRGAFNAMKSALRNAGVSPENVAYINAHATSTPLGDAAECAAIKQLFGSHSKQLAVSSTKGAIGHLLGAAGATETLFTVLACHYGRVPPTVNLESPSEGLDLNFVPNVAQDWPKTVNLRRVALTNSFGFGGTNASICISSI